MSRSLLRVTQTPDVAPRPDGGGGFRPDSFAELLGRHVAFPGLDPAYTHTLVAVDVAPDGSAAELTIVSEAHAPLRIGASLRVVSSTPPAYVRVVDPDGTVLAEGPHPGPLREGQEVAVGGDHYRVQSTAWPHRDPRTRAAAADRDWQVATVTPHPRPAATARAAS